MRSPTRAGSAWPSSAGQTIPGRRDTRRDVLIGFEEKPERPKSHFIPIGVYFLRPDVFDVIGQLVPSARGEFEITDVLITTCRLAASSAALRRALDRRRHGRLADRGEPPGGGRRRARAIAATARRGRPAVTLSRVGAGVFAPERPAVGPMSAAAPDLDKADLADHSPDPRMMVRPVPKAHRSGDGAYRSLLVTGGAGSSAAPSSATCCGPIPRSSSLSSTS